MDENCLLLVFSLQKYLKCLPLPIGWDLGDGVPHHDPASQTHYSLPIYNITTLPLVARGWDGERVIFNFGYNCIFIGNSQKIFFLKGKEICDDLLSLGFFLPSLESYYRGKCQVENMVIATRYHC